MRPSTMVRGAALGAAASLIALSVAPAHAADAVARSTARAVDVTVAGNNTGPEGYTSTHDGSQESTFGSNEPALRLLGNQDAASVGTLAQDAKTWVEDGQGAAAACSGIAGDGASLVEVGEGSCLEGGDNLVLNVGTLDLTGLRVVDGAALDMMPVDIQKELENAGLSLDMLLEPLSQGLQAGAEALGSPGLYLDLGAITSECTANARGLTADSMLADASLYLQLPAIAGNEARRIDLLALPVAPDPNTEVVTGLDDVTATLVEALRTQIETTLTKNNAPPPVDQVLNALGMGGEQLVNQLDPVLQEITGQLAQQLAPVEENLLRVTLNAQNRTEDQINVTAIDARVLPAAKQFLDADLARIRLATSQCGPTGPVVARDTPETDEPAPPKEPKVQPASHQGAPVPTEVTAGVAEAETGPSAGTTALMALLTLGAAGAGAVTYRRLRQH